MNLQLALALIEHGVLTKGSKVTANILDSEGSPKTVYTEIKVLRDGSIYGQNINTKNKEFFEFGIEEIYTIEGFPVEVFAKKFGILPDGTRMSRGRKPV